MQTDTKLCCVVLIDIDANNCWNTEYSDLFTQYSRTHRNYCYKTSQDYRSGNKTGSKVS